MALAVVVAAAAAHLLVVGVCYAIGYTARLIDPEGDSHAGPLDVAIIDDVAPEPAPPEPPPTEAKPSQADDAPAQKALHPEPIDATTEPPQKPEPTRRRVVGLSFESTISGGAGPGFAVGNTRRGNTERVAQDPTDIGSLPIEFTPPKRLRSFKPRYPAALKSQRIEADVVLSVTIDTQGRVASVTIVRGSRYPAFNEAAVAAARRGIYDPARRNGVAVPQTIQFTVRFRLTDR